MNALSPAFPAGALANAGEARLCEMVFPEQATITALCLAAPRSA